MNKLKQLFKTNLTSPSSINKQNLPACSINQSNTKGNQCQINHQPSQTCQQCSNKSLLIQKYSRLIKLLKIKISKLQNQLHRLNKNKDEDLINQFYDYKMELDSASVQTLKSKIQKSDNPQKQLKLNPIIETPFDKKHFDKTVKKQDKIKVYKKQKVKTKFISEHKILSDSENTRQIIARTQKEILKHEDKDQSGKVIINQGIRSISFIDLMQKSQVQIRSSKKIIWNSQLNQQKIFQNKTVNKKRDQSQISLKNNNKDFKGNQKEEQKQVIKKEYEKRIEYLCSTILELKSFLLHIRQSIFQFVKMTELVKLGSKDGNSEYMLGIIIKMFEYSEDELNQMIYENRKVNKSLMKTFIQKSLGR